MKVVFSEGTALSRRQLKTLHISIILLSPRANAKFGPLFPGCDVSKRQKRPPNFSELEVIRLTAGLNLGILARNL